MNYAVLLLSALEVLTALCFGKRGKTCDPLRHSKLGLDNLNGQVAPIGWLLSIPKLEGARYSRQAILSEHHVNCQPAMDVFLTQIKGQ